MVFVKPFGLRNLSSAKQNLFGEWGGETASLQPEFLYYIMLPPEQISCPIRIYRRMGSIPENAIYIGLN